MNHENLEKMVSEVLAIEAEEAKQAGALGFMARALVQATLPHSKVEGNEFIRKNGIFKLTLLADSETGLPYGSIPRLLLAWISTEAIKTQNRQLMLGKTLSEFMEALDLMPTGGRWGSITRLKEQMQKLLSCSISCTRTNSDNWAIKNITPVSSADLWWNPKQPNQTTMFESSLTLNEDFYREIIEHPIPIDLRALKALKRSPLAIDIYCWMTYRVSYLRKSINIPWAALQTQFGSSYPSTPQGTRNFKRHFLKELHKVCFVYAQLKVDENKSGLIIKPSNTHIARPFVE